MQLNPPTQPHLPASGTETSTPRSKVECATCGWCAAIEASLCIVLAKMVPCRCTCARRKALKKTPCKATTCCTGASDRARLQKGPATIPWGQGGTRQAVQSMSHTMLLSEASRQQRHTQAEVATVSSGAWQRIEAITSVGKWRVCWFASVMVGRC